MRHLAWLYWGPNPLLPFVAFRVALDGDHPDLLVEEMDPPQEPAAGTGERETISTRR